MRKALIVALNGVLTGVRQKKFYFALFLNFILMKQIIDLIKTFSVYTGIKVVPAVFPFLMQQSYIQLVFIAGITLVFCDAPFMEYNTTYEMIRTGKMRWLMGKIMYMFCMSIIYTGSIIAITVLLLFPRFTFSTGWGKVLTTIASSNALEQLGIGFFSIDYSIIIKDTPLRAVSLAALISIVVCFLTGTCILMINTCFKHIPGSFGGIAIALLPYFQHNFSNLYTMSFWSPASWLDINLWDASVRLHYPSVTYMIVFFAVSISLSVVVSCVVYGRKDDVLAVKGKE